MSVRGADQSGERNALFSSPALFFHFKETICALPSFTTLEPFVLPRRFSDDRK